MAITRRAAIKTVLATAVVSAIDYYRRFQMAFPRSGKVADIEHARARRERGERKIG